MKGFRTGTLRANFSWTLLGRVVFSFAQWGLLAVLARLATPQVVGEYTLGLAVTAPIFVLAGLNLRAVLATDAGQSASFGNYLLTRAVTTILATAAVWLVARMVGYEPHVLHVILLVALMKAAEAIQDIIYGRFQQLERMDFIAKSRLIRGPLLLVAAGVTYLLTSSLAYTVASLILSTLLVLVLYDLPAVRRASSGAGAGARGADASESGVSADRVRSPTQGEGDGSQLDWRAVGRLVQTALPLGVSMMLVSLSVSAPHLIIERQMGEYSLGLYAALSYLAVAGNTIISSLGQAASPRLAKQYSLGQRSRFTYTLRRLLLVALSVGAAGVVVGALAGEPLLALVYGSDYANQGQLLVLILGYAAVTYVTTSLGVALTSTRRFKVQLPVNVGMVAAVILLSLVLIPGYGLFGAIVAQALAQIGKAIVYALLVNQALRQSDARAFSYARGDLSRVR